MYNLSIIIINYNTFELTSKCIASIQAFTKGITCEIILVDNNSTQCNPEKFIELFPFIKLLKNKTNSGFAKGNNLGCTLASADTILLLNSDTELVDNAIFDAYQLLIQKKAEGVRVVTGKLLYPDGRVQHQCGRFPSIVLQLVELLRLQKLMTKRQRGDLLLGGFFDHDRPVYPDWIWGTFFMFEKDILQYFPEKKLTETYFMYQEDLEWCYYIRKSGFRIFYEPKINIIHHFSSSSNTAALVSKKQQLLQFNYIDFLRRHYGNNYTRLFLFIQKLNKKIQLR